MKLSRNAALMVGLSLAATSPAESATKVAFVPAEGGLGDLSFNDMIAAGLNKAKKDLGVDYVVIRTTTGLSTA